MKVPEVLKRMACGTPSASVKPTVAPFIRVSLNFSDIPIWPLVRRRRWRAGRDRNGPDGLAVLRDPHLLALGIDVGDLIAADLESDRLLLDAVDAFGALDPVERQPEGNGGSLLPVILGAAVHAVGVEPMAGDFLATGGRNGDAFLNGCPVDDCLVRS
jgi:hypothetical protein